MKWLERLKQRPLLKRGLVCLFIFGICSGNTDCNRTDNTDYKQANATENMIGAANAKVGMPAITRFTERQLMRQLYELRDKQLVTYAYGLDREGRLHFICYSVGYGLPYSTQFTNPQRLVENNETSMTGNITLPQPEPNGLHMPSSALGTWVMCLDPATNRTAPIYWESDANVSPFPLKAVDSYGPYPAPEPTIPKIEILPKKAD